jgi:uncharacterized protein (DUF2141 family)
MISKTTLLLFLFLCGKLSAQTHSLTIQVTNIKNDKGKIGIAIYNSEKDFLKKHYEAKSTKAMMGQATIVVENLPIGYYAISLIHDANENDKMDTNLIGIPKEGFGFSNNVMGTFGPPSFEKAKVEVRSDKSISILLKYF